MTVRISYLVDVSKEFRKAMNHHYGHDGLATRDQIKTWYYTFGQENDNNLRHEHAVCCWGEEPYLAPEHPDYHPRE